MRITNIIVIYFVVGAVLFGGGAIDYSETGVASYFVEQDGGSFVASDDAQGELQGVGGAISSLVGQFAGPLVLVWNLIVGLVGFSMWPLLTLLSNDAPPRVALLLGGSLTASFYLSLIALVRSSA